MDFAQQRLEIERRIERERTQIANDLQTLRSATNPATLVRNILTGQNILAVQDESASSRHQFSQAENGKELVTNLLHKALPMAATIAGAYLVSRLSRHPWMTKVLEGWRLYQSIQILKSVNER